MSSLSAISICMVIMFNAEAPSDRAKPPPSTIARLGDAQFRPLLSGKWALGLSTDGRWLAVIPAADVGLIDVYDTKDGTLFRTLRSELTAVMPGGIAFSSDGSTVFAADGEKSILIWNLWTRKRIGHLDCAEPWCVAVSPVSSLIAVGSARGTAIQLREWPSGRVLREFNTTPTIGTVLSLAFSRDGKQLAAFGAGRYAVWRVSDSVSLSTADLGANGWDFSAWDGNLSQAIQASSSRRTLQIHNLSDGRVAREIKTPEGNCIAAFLGSRDEIAVARQCPSLHIEVINRMTGLVTGEMKGHIEPLIQLKCSADGSLLIGRSQSRIWVWDCHTRQLKSYCKGAGPVSELVFSANNDVIASCSKTIELPSCPDGDRSRFECPEGVRFWKCSTGSLLHHEPDCRFAGFSAGEDSAWTWSHNGTIRCFDTKTYLPLRTLCLQRTPKQQERLRLVEAAEVDGPRASQIRLRHWHNTPSAIRAAGIALTELTDDPDSWGMSVFGGGWGVPEGLPQLPKADGASLGPIDEIAVSQNGKTLAFLQKRDDSGESFGRIGIWSTEEHGRTLWLESGPATPYGFVVAANGQYLMALSSRRDDNVRDTVQLWETKSGKRHRTWDIAESISKSDNTALAVSADVKWFAVGSDDGRVRLWKIGDDGPESVATLVGHTAAITALAFSPDTRRLAAGSADSTVLVYELRHSTD